MFVYSLNFFFSVFYPILAYGIPILFHSVEQHPSYRQKTPYFEQLIFSI